MTDRKHTPATSHLVQNGETPLTHQERVYFEMFRGIELLGRKLEKSEAIREELSRRLHDLESSAARDEATGKYYLPAKIEPANVSAAPEAVMNRRITMAAALAGLALGAIALGLSLTQHAPQTLSPRQLAALNNLADAQDAPVFADHASGGWRKVLKEENAAQTTLADENVTAEIAGAAQDAPPAFELAASLEQLKDVAAAKDTLAEAVTEVQADMLDADLPEDMAQGDTDMAEEETGLGHDDLAALVEQENTVDAYYAAEAETDAPSAMVGPLPVAESAPAGKPAETVSVLNTAPAAPEKQAESARTEPAPQHSAYTSEPLRDPYLPSIYADLERRAYDGIGEAQHDLAALYAAGGRVRPDYPRAVYWFRRAADAGIANAYYNLGVMAQQGLGMAKDAKEAFAFYGRAARLGHPEAMYNLGLAYIEGRGTAKDNLRGIAYFKKAANAGLTQAAYNLGVIYEGGTVEGHRDLKSALEWYHVAAVEGHDEAAAAIRRIERLHMQAEALSIADKVEPAAGK